MPDHGRIVQIGAPTELYDRLATPDVSGSLGNPAMNRIAPDFVSAAPMLSARSGIRPEDLRVTVDVRSPITAGEPLGGYSAMTIAGGGRSLRAILAGRPAFRPGNAVAVSADPACVHVFGPGRERLAR